MIDKQLTKVQCRVSNLLGDKDMKTFIKMIRDDRGASAAEYALILAVVGAVIALAALTLSGAIGTAMNSTADCIKNPSAGNTNCTA